MPGIDSSTNLQPTLTRREPAYPEVKASPFSPEVAVVLGTAIRANKQIAKAYSQADSWQATRRYQCPGNSCSLSQAL